LGLADARQALAYFVMQSAVAAIVLCPVGLFPFNRLSMVCFSA
jgi:hypothetical protein